MTDHQLPRESVAMPRFVDLSHPICDGQLSYPKDPPLRVKPFRTIASGGCNVTQIEMGTHEGTHLDAPFHFLDDGATLDQIPLERFFGPACLVDLAPGGELPPKAAITPEVLQPHASVFAPGARVLYRTGWDRRFGAPEFFTECPSLTRDAARWIADRRIALLGMDVPTPSKIAGHEVHRILLGKGVEIVIVEGLARLELLPARFTFIGFPLNFAGRDGSPIRAVALID